MTEFSNGEALAETSDLAMPDLASDFAMLALESQTVVALRMFGLCGFWPMAASERERMVSEKPLAFARSAAAAAAVATEGGRSDEILAAALQPLRTKTRANMRRLSRKARA